jgi:hypothetical protein
MGGTDSIEAFAAVTHIKAGDWDRFLVPILAAARERADLLNPDVPPRTRLPQGQVWAWMNGPGAPHWETRGAGVPVEGAAGSRPL